MQFQLPEEDYYQLALSYHLSKDFAGSVFSLGTVGVLVEKWIILAQKYMTSSENHYIQKNVTLLLLPSPIS